MIQNKNSNIHNPEIIKKMNVECTKCMFSSYYHGKCEGKKGGNPCLAFKKVAD